MDNIKVGCVQLDSGPDIQENLNAAQNLIREAAGQGATLIVTPEVTDQVIPNRAQKVDEALTQQNHPGVPFFANLAKELGIDLVIGSMIIKKGDGDIANRSFHFDEIGALKATYDKIHLYDVDLPNGEKHYESHIFTSGHDAILSDVQGVKLGMTVCYDLRFSYLYRDLGKGGAKIITIPAAFTMLTGLQCWEVFVRARALEAQAFIIAPAQAGDHAGARKTYGHSMIVSPWGEILAEMGDKIGMITADLNLKEVEEARKAVPSLQHDRPYTIKT